MWTRVLSPLALLLLCRLAASAGRTGSSTSARTLLRTHQAPPTEVQEFGTLADVGNADTQLGIGAPLDANALSEPSCEVTLSGSICFGDKGQGVLPPAIPAGLIGHWNFDTDDPIDVSGNGNNGLTSLVHGPAPTGGGHSAAFTKNFMSVPDSALLHLTDFTYSFWVYLQDDGLDAAEHSSAWCPLLRKGINEVETQQFASAPAILFSRRTGQFRAEVTTEAKGLQDGEFMDSNARLQPNRWVHVAIAHHSARSTLLLYVNGILDSAMSTQGKMITNSYPLYVGGDPFTVDQCAFTVYIDELRAYSHAVAPHHLQAEAAPALGGTDPSYVRLGCAKCSLLEAARSCPADRHICTSLELHTGGYQVARSLGWLAANTVVWTHAAIAHGAEGEMAGQGHQGFGTLGLGLCCEGAP